MNDLAQKLVDRGLGIPAIFLLEASKPLTTILHQFLIFMGPFVGMLGLYGSEYQHWLHVTEERDRVEGLIQDIEGRR